MVAASKPPEHWLRRLWRYTTSTAYTAWLFTRSDVKTILVPTAIFGVCNYLALPAYGLEPDVGSRLSSRFGLVFFWIWIHLVSFNVDNQRSPESVREDALNKPWRPLPSGRVSLRAAYLLSMLMPPVTVVCSLLVGTGWRQSLGIVLLTSWYNRWGGSDTNPLTRNAITGFGYMCFTSGALEVAYGKALPLDGSNRQLMVWLCVLGAIVTTTMHVQDMEDQEGDGQRGRRTAPLVLGDGPCRWTIALPMVGWAVACPSIWRPALPMAGVSTALALTVALRTLILRRESSDRRTFWVWNAWMSSLYMMPLFSR
ncbi:UbiA prenyltransferase family-domain-containing protein [Ophiocordyceps camponoti-floridani]|uniref:UbiA prenyltransferase family-domain-containing protein n=1 Tax=Ophiocordyceps camponoti-floridani TaxID=2030778 RepID=A0A8H4VGX9_9HYPO|nr:UbiA prenyltransferase family-domain-containing protein [Ophiocordyceps camponoti-floridani]